MALCFFALRCRHLSLRERALEILLYQPPERRGVWHRISFLRGAELKLYIEKQEKIERKLPTEEVEATRERVVEPGEKKVRFYFRRSGDDEV